MCSRFLCRADGKELFYFAPDSTLTAVSVTTTGATFQPGVPKALFRAAVLGGESRRPAFPDQHGGRRGSRHRRLQAALKK